MMDQTHLSSKALNVVLLGVEGLLSDKQGKLAVLHFHLLDLCIKEFLDALPDEERTGTQDVAACTQTLCQRMPV